LHVKKFYFHNRKAVEQIDQSQ